MEFTHCIYPICTLSYRALYKCVFLCAKCILKFCSAISVGHEILSEKHITL